MVLAQVLFGVSPLPLLFSPVIATVLCFFAACSLKSPVVAHGDLYVFQCHCFYCSETVSIG